MRTPEEIVDRIRRLEGDDMFKFQTPDLIVFLSFEHARTWLDPETTPDDWQEPTYTFEGVLRRVEGYLPFAWEKCDSERGISVWRAVGRFSAWLWLLGDDVYRRIPWDDPGHYQRNIFEAVRDVVRDLRRSTTAAQNVPALALIKDNATP